MEAPGGVITLEDSAKVCKDIFLRGVEVPQTPQKFPRKTTRTWLGSQKKHSARFWEWFSTQLIVIGTILFEPFDFGVPNLDPSSGFGKIGSLKPQTVLASNHFLVAPNIEVKWGHTYLSWIIKCLANSFTNKNAPTFHCWLHLYFHSIHHTV